MINDFICNTDFKVYSGHTLHSNQWLHIPCSLCSFGLLPKAQQSLSCYRGDNINQNEIQISSNSTLFPFTIDCWPIQLLLPWKVWDCRSYKCEIFVRIFWETRLGGEECDLQTTTVWLRREKEYDHSVKCQLCSLLCIKYTDPTTSPVSFRPVRLGQSGDVSSELTRPCQVRLGATTNMQHSLSI